MLLRRGLLVFATLFIATALRGAAAPDAGAADAFYHAIRANDLQALDALIAAHADVNAPDPEGIPPLMHAAAFGSIAAMQRLLSAGADINITNSTKATPLMWSVREMAKVQLLLDKGANVNAASTTGRTALLLAAMSEESAAVVKLLLSKGADVQVVDAIGMTALHAATYGDDIDTIGMIMDRKLDPNTRDIGGYTPLMNASAAGNLTAVKMLLAAGARVNDASDVGDVRTHTTGRVKNGRLALSGFTPLLLSAPTGPSAVTRTLLDAGADINARDGRGMTALMLAIATDHADPEMITLLLARGADVALASEAHETALDWALKFGDTPIAAMIVKAGGRATAAPPVTVPPAAPVGAGEAFRRGSALLGRTSATFFAKGGCAACHSQNVMDVVRAVATARGIRLDAADAAASLVQTRNRYSTAIPQLLERQDAAGTPDVPMYAMLALKSAGQQPDRMTNAVAVNLAAQQQRDGRWHTGGQARAPMQDGDFTRTALTVYAIANYGPPARADLHARIERARAWLLAHPATTNEDRNFRLLGLKWSGADAASIARAAGDVVAAQRPDGGWAQSAHLASDAYATGQALYALAAGAGFPSNHAAYERGVRFLAATQRADGSWYVASRSVKFQPYFESGFPYGHDQWISMMATGWSSAALAFALPPESATAAR